MVLKQGAPTDLAQLFAALQKGQRYIPKAVIKLIDSMNVNNYSNRPLSPKESEVLRLFANGFLVTEIAKKFNRIIKTISSQKKSAMTKLGVDTDIDLLNYLCSIRQSIDLFPNPSSLCEVKAHGAQQPECTDIAKSV